MHYTLLVLICLAFVARHAAGQGLIPSHVPPVGASNTLSQLQQQYKNSKAWKRAYKQRPSSVCARSGSASLCAAQGKSSTDAYAQLMLATSPQAYSSADTKVRLVAPAQDQSGCQTCTAFAVAGAAETAMASALQVDVLQCSISVQALFFCAPNEPIKSCESGWSLRDALQQLQQRGQSLPTTKCLPYRPDFYGDQSAEALCKRACNDANEYASGGKFSSQAITSVWKAQQHIRQYGAVVSRFDVYSDFDSFFASKSNAQAVYRPSASAYFQYYHAIVLVGYDNEQQYWLAKNSYGSDWGDDEFFKVAYGVCAILAADKGEAYGIVWKPNIVPEELRLPVTVGPRKDCYWYQSQPDDYLSKVAWLAGIRLDKFMLDNTEVVRDLDAPLQGIQLLLCNPATGALKVSPAGITISLPDTTRGQDPVPNLSEVDQLASLLRIKAAIDTSDVLKQWTKATGSRECSTITGSIAGYCCWPGVSCHVMARRGTQRYGKHTSDVEVFAFSTVAGSKRIQGLKGSLPSAASFTGLGGLTQLEFIDQPGLSGTLPEDWSGLTRVWGITMINTSVSGSIPSGWARLRKLATLSLADSKLHGLLPPWLGSLEQLKVLILANSSFTGSIPASIGDLSMLQALALGGNKLGGTLPEALRALRSLQYLDLSNNHLSGTVPASWSGMTSLKVVALSGNPQLHGCLPAPWKQQLNTAVQGYDLKRWVFNGTSIKSFC